MTNFQRIFLFNTVFTLLIGSTAFAKDYKIEAIIFQHHLSDSIYESTDKDPISVPQSMSKTWEITPSLLKSQSLYSNRNYSVIKHVSWGQKSLPSSKAAIYSIYERDLQGWFKVYADHLLFVKLDLEYDGYRLTENRRLKLNEKHYFDHPKFGVLLQVSRLVKPKEQSLEGIPQTQIKEKNASDDIPKLMKSR